MTFFAELMEKTEEERATVALIGAVVVVLLLVAVWVSFRFWIGNNYAINENQNIKQSASAASSFSNFIDETKGSIDDLKNQYNKIKDVTGSRAGAQAARAVLSPDSLSTSTIEAATKNFMRVYTNQKGEVQVDVSDLEKTQIPPIRDFPY